MANVMAVGRMLVRQKERHGFSVGKKRGKYEEKMWQKKRGGNEIPRECSTKEKKRPPATSRQILLEDDEKKGRGGVRYRQKEGFGP